MTPRSSKTPRVIVFDVNETLLDLAALDPAFERAFGETEARQEWFARMISTAFVSVITNHYVDFGSIGQAALEMTAESRKVVLSEPDAREILLGMLALPAHPDVPESLGRLQESGLRLAALTNSTKAAADAQLEHAGLHGFFEQVLSVEYARRLKPHPEVYRMAAQRLVVEPSGMRLVAAHSWDVTGAIRAGCTGAFLARPGKLLGSLDEHPDVVGSDLREVTDRILEVELVG